MKAIIIFVVLTLGGCASGRAVRLVQTSAPEVGAVRLEYLETNGRVVTLKMTNVSGVPLQYLHWFGQGPEPVTYCRRADGSQCICSTRITLNDDDTEWVHENYLYPGRSTLIHAQATEMASIGIPVYATSPFRQELLWFTLPYAPNPSLERP